MEGIRSFVLFECFRIISLRLWDSVGVFSAVIITEASYFPSPAGISVLPEVCEDVRSWITITSHGLLPFLSKCLGIFQQGVGSKLKTTSLINTVLILTALLCLSFCSSMCCDTGHLLIALYSSGGRRI